MDVPSRALPACPKSLHPIDATKWGELLHLADGPVARSTRRNGALGPSENDQPSGVSVHRGETEDGSGAAVAKMYDAPAESGYTR